MRLRGRFTLWFSLAALVPIAVAALVTREVVSKSFTEDFENRRESAKRNLGQRLQEIEEGVLETMRGMVEEQYRHPLVGGVLLELQKTGGQLTPQFQKQIDDDSNGYRRGMELDVLYVLDTEDRVLVAPHYRPALHTTDAGPAARVREAGDRAFYVHEPTIRGDQIARILVVEAVGQQQQGRHRVTAVGAREIGRDLLDWLRQSEQIDARVVDAQGRVLIPSARPWDTESSNLMSVSLPGPDGAPVAAIEVAFSRAELTRVLEQVTLSALVLAVAALLVTVLLGVFLARRMTANLDRLVAGAQAASRGDLEHRVRVETRDEIGELAASFNTMMADLETAKERLVIAERIAAWQEIARRLAHEIKNPLTPIQMSVETMRKSWHKKHPSFEEIFDESTSTILEETARLKRIVSEFSEFARMPKPMLLPCDVSDVVASCLALYQGAIPIERELAEGLPEILCDRDQLSQMLLNLVENARDAIENRPSESADAGAGRIAVTTRASQSGDRVLIVVEDNGPGIPDEVKERLFTPYFTTKQGGTGLGLAIVHRMVSDHGGRITASDAPSGGARFIVEFPANESRPRTRRPRATGSEAAKE